MKPLLGAFLTPPTLPVVIDSARKECRSYVPCPYWLYANNSVSYVRTWVPVCRLRGWRAHSDMLKPLLKPGMFQGIVLRIKEVTRTMAIATPETRRGNRQ